MNELFAFHSFMSVKTTWGTSPAPNRPLFTTSGCTLIDYVGERVNSLEAAGNK